MNKNAIIIGGPSDPHVNKGDTVEILAFAKAMNGKVHAICTNLETGLVGYVHPLHLKIIKSDEETIQDLVHWLRSYDNGLWPDEIEEKIKELGI